MAGGGGDGSGLRLSRAEDDDEVAVLVDGKWVNAGGDEASSKRKMAAPLEIASKKLLMEHGNGSQCGVSRRENDSVENTSSNLTENEVARLLETANVSPIDYEFSVPSKDDRANKPPEGYISVYAEQVGAGLRFPLHDLVLSICNVINVCPTQLLPNAHLMIVGFILCAKLYNIPITADYFFSMFAVNTAPVFGLFKIGHFKGKKFLEDKPSSHGLWKRKFFFLRPRGKSWNCITKWNETFLQPKVDAALAAFALRSGILEHHFRVNNLTCKELLVHGGIEPGVPSPGTTFRYLMNKAAVTKFDLLPEERSTACGTTEAAKPPSKAPLYAPPPRPPPKSTRYPAAFSTSTSYATLATIPFMKTGNTGQSYSTLPTSTAGAGSPFQLTFKHPVRHQQSLSSLRDIIPMKELELFGKGKVDQTTKSFVSHVNTKFAAPILEDKAPPPQALPDHFLTMLQVLESNYVPKESHQKLEMELTSELAFTKSRVEELKQELELSEAKRVDSDNRAFLAMETVKALEKRAQSQKTESNQLHDNIRKEAIEEFKHSNEFFTLVQEKAYTYYAKGFEVCQEQFLKVGRLPKGFDLDFLDVNADEWGKPPGYGSNKSSKLMR